MTDVGRLKQIQDRVSLFKNGFEQAGHSPGRHYIEDIPYLLTQLQAAQEREAELRSLLAQGQQAVRGFGSILTDNEIRFLAAADTALAQTPPVSEAGEA